MTLKIVTRGSMTLFLFLVFTSSFSLRAQSIASDSWQSKEVAPGLVWMSAHVDLFNSRQNINVLEIDLSKREITLVYDPKKNEVTSAMARQAEALAAVNAGFFDMINGGSVTYLKMDGKLLGDSTKWKRNVNLNGALIVKSDGSVDVELAKEDTYYTNKTEFDDVLITGALLIDERDEVVLADNSFVNNRHPRTCLGIVDRNKVILVTVDGRNAQAAGMTLEELTALMKSLNCKEAINLDGGGSTTMWISSESTGVVNRPSDNRTFDSLGERKVANILAVK